MREAILQAFEAWASQLPSVALTAGPKPKRRRQPERASMGQQLLHPADTRPSEMGPSLADVPGLEALVGDWVSNAAQLDWSKCPAAECVQTKTGNVWVASGTLVPLVHIFEAVAGDNPLPEIAEVYDLTLQQLIAILQFAAESAAPYSEGGKQNRSAYFPAVRWNAHGGRAHPGSRRACEIAPRPVEAGRSSSRTLHRRAGIRGAQAGTQGTLRLCGAGDGHPYSIGPPMEVGDINQEVGVACGDRLTAFSTPAWEHPSNRISPWSVFRASVFSRISFVPGLSEVVDTIQIPGKTSVVSVTRSKRACGQALPAVKRSGFPPS